MRKNRRAQAVIAMAVAAGMVLAGCSGQSETERDAQESESAQETGNRVSGCPGYPGGRRPDRDSGGGGSQPEKCL